MKQDQKKIQGIPVTCWGKASKKVILAFHGDQSHKEDTVIQLLAEYAAKKGYQVWSFDLPEHGERKQETYTLNPKNVVADVNKILVELKEQADCLSLFGCSIGAYFGMLACQNMKIDQSFLLSPIVDMKELIENMMLWSQVTPEDLKREKKIVTPDKTLDWAYYSYVVEHPIKWTASTKILYGAKDFLTSRKTLKTFSEATKSEVTIFEAGEHFFNTPEQLSVYQKWLEASL